MNLRSLALFLLSSALMPSILAAQGVRFGDLAPVTRIQTIASAKGNFITAVQGTVNFCSAPANAVPCTNKAVTYTDVTLTVPCSSSVQLTIANSSSCVGITDLYGNWGVWAASGTYAYTFTISGQSYGPFPATLGGSGGSAGGTPAGFNTYVQYNDNGAFGGSAGFTFDKASGNFAVPGIVSGQGFVSTSSGSWFVNSPFGAAAKAPVAGQNGAAFDTASGQLFCSQNGGAYGLCGAATGTVLTAPTVAQTVLQPAAGGATDGTSLNANVFEQTRYADKFAWSQTPAGTISAPGASTTITVATNNTSTGIVTLTFGANPFSINQYIQVTGMTPSGYNGRYRVLSATGTQVTYQQNYQNLTVGTVMGAAVRNDQTITINAVRGISAFSVYPGTGAGPDYVQHSLYISGVGTPEPVLLTATTCTGASTGTCTITVSAAFAHGAGYTIGTATAGFQEALVDCVSLSASNPLGGCKIAGAQPQSNGNYVLRAPFCIGARQAAEKGVLDIDGQGVVIESLVLGGPAFQVNCEVPYSALSSGNAGGHVIIEHFSFVPKVGIGRAANGTQIAILNKGQNVSINHNVFPPWSVSTDVFDTTIQVTGDQAAEIDNNHFVANTKCDSTFCGPTILADTVGNAGVGKITHNYWDGGPTSFNPKSAFDWLSGNGLIIFGNVFQSWSKYAWLYNSGLIDITNNCGNYYEANAAAINPDFGVAGFADSAGPQIFGNHSYTTDCQEMGFLPAHVFDTHGANVYNYYAVPLSGANKGRPLFLGIARSDNVTNYTVQWLIGGNATSWDLLRIGPLALDGTDSAPYGGSPTNYAVSTGNVAGAGICSTTSCTFTENFAAPTAYTVSVRGDWNPSIPYWPVPIFMGANASVLRYIGPAVSGIVSAGAFSDSTYWDGEFTSPGYGPIESVSAQAITGFRTLLPMAANLAGNTTAFILNPAPDQINLTGKKGRINIGATMSHTVTNNCDLTLFDSNPAKTFATLGHRGSNDTADIALCRENRDTMAFQFGVNPASFYVNHVPDGGTSKVGQVTTQGLVSKVAAGYTSTLNGGYGYDSTNNMLHASQTGADAFVPQFTAVPANNDCVKWVVSGSNYKLGTQGSACGGASVPGADTNVIFNDTGAFNANAGLKYDKTHTLTVSVAGNGNAVLALAGNTSGTATFTAPAVAGTSGNPVLSSNSIQLPDGTQALQAIRMTTSALGWWYGANNPAWIFGNATDRVGINVSGNTSMVMNSAGLFGFASSASVLNAANMNLDTSISRSAAGVLAVGSGTGAATTGRLKASAYMSVGTKFTSNAGCTESATTGGASAGKFTVGQNTACTIVITMGDTATSPNGWSCGFSDETAVPAVALRQTASTTTTASILMTVATNDVVNFHCVGY